jgi:hypothetical protein
LSLQHPILRRSLAGILLVLFAFSNMPKKVLHDWIVSHTDGVSNQAKSTLTQVSKAGFNCECQSLVAESPFTADSQHIDLGFYQDYSLAPCSFSSQVHSTTLFSHSLRGPPPVC